MFFSWKSRSIPLREICQRRRRLKNHLRSERRLVRRATLPTDTRPLDTAAPDNEPLRAELKEVKRLRSVLSELDSNKSFNNSHRDAKACVDAELAKIVEALDGQITRSQNRAIFRPGFHSSTRRPNPFVLLQLTH
jgi:hypothetical protein